MSNRPFQQVIDEARASFIQGTVSLTVASRDEQLRPSVCKAVGCRLSADRGEVRVLLPREDIGEVLDHVRATGVVAFVVSDPISHEALQLKAVDAREVEAEPGDEALVAAYTASLADLLAGIDMPPAFVAQVRSWGRSGLAAIAFTARAVYLQTPGPRAGEALGAAT